MPRILIVYSTQEGHTASVSQRMAEMAREKGFKVDLCDINYLPASYAQQEFDAYILGGSIHMGRYQNRLKEFIKANRARLENRPSAFFTVCLAAAVSGEEARQQLAEYLAKLTQETGWKPGLVKAFPGALLYTQYGLIKRLIMKVIAGKAGKDTDISRDYVYTDWSEVAGFTDEFLALLDRSMLAGSAAS